jgi:translation initiation factor eIF-2B subunit delta
MTEKSDKQQDSKKAKAPPPGLVIPPKKAPLSKAERRAVQEAQRAAKGLQGSNVGSPPLSSTAAVTATTAQPARARDVGGSSSVSNKAGASSHQSTPSAAASTVGAASMASGSISRKGSSVSETADSKAHSIHPSNPSSRTSAGSGTSISSVLFSHLPSYKGISSLTLFDNPTLAHNSHPLPTCNCTDPLTWNREFSGVQMGGHPATSALHPAVLHLGYLYASGLLRGGNARCRAMLRTFQTVLDEYTRPPHVKDIRLDMDSRILKPSFQFWTQSCRTHSVSMGNAFSFLKLAIMSPQTRDISETHMKEYLHETIDAYIQERIEFADKAICKYASTKILPAGDVILTYGYSEVIEQLLIHAATQEHKVFRVICVDARPLLEGRMLLEALVHHNIPCTYVLLNALSYVMMKDVTKVFLGAAALTSNGAVLSRVGTACVALMAQKAARNIPVLVCCETYKITPKVQLESITSNELGNPQDLLSIPCALDRSNAFQSSMKNGGVLSTDFLRDNTHLNLLQILYDLTPSDFVSGVVCEMGIVPPTSVAVILREMNQNGETTGDEL